MMTNRKHLAAAVLMGSICLAAQAGDWAQYRGPEHDGSSPEKILKEWPSTGLPEVWKVPMKDGFSAITLGAGKAYTLVARDVDGLNQEVCIAVDANNGKELWATPLGIAKYDGGGASGTPSNGGGDGPRSTPSFDDGKVYVYSAQMVLRCLNAADGKEIWKKDMIREFNGKNITWQSAASPLVDGDLVFVACGATGQSLVALNKKDGSVAWKGQDDSMKHATPIIATIHGVRQVIFLTGSGLVSVVPKTGAVLWRLKFDAARPAAGASPVVSGDMVYCSIAYGLGSRACKITKEGDNFTATELWFKPGNLQANHWGTPVASGGYVYGIFDQAKHGQAPLKCVEIATGEIKWSQNGFGMGGCTLVDGQVMVLSDAGDLVLVKASPDKYTETARTHILSGKCWNNVGISNGRLYARSTKEGVCLNIAPKSMASR
jgi:outer membrane protein assembly factor BamB